MKIQSKVGEFKPVTITLETQEELDLFAEIFYHVGGMRIVEVFGDTSAIINGLLKHGAVHPECSSNIVTGDIHIG